MIHTPILRIFFWSTMSAVVWNMSANRSPSLFPKNPTKTLISSKKKVSTYIKLKEGCKKFHFQSWSYHEKFLCRHLEFFYMCYLFSDFDRFAAIKSTRVKKLTSTFFLKGRSYFDKAEQMVKMCESEQGPKSETVAIKTNQMAASTLIDHKVSINFNLLDTNLLKGRSRFNFLR